MSTTPVRLDFSTFEPIAAAPTQKPVTLDFSTFEPMSAPGEQINDVGNKVIVPKQDESFADTMQRGANYGQTVTPQQRSAELASAPGKIATVLTSAPAIGAAIPAAMVGAGATAPAAAPIARALAPIAKKYGIKALEGAGLGVGYQLYSELKKIFE
jgi:hypothetical protein